MSLRLGVKFILVAATCCISENKQSVICNIGNDSEPISVKDLAEKVIHLSGKDDISPQFVLMEDSDRTKEREVYNRIPSIEKAKSQLSYASKVSLDEGIRRVIEYKRSLNEK